MKSDAVPRWLIALPFPILLIVVWQLAVSFHWIKLIPGPAAVAVTIYDFTFGGVYDYAYSHTMLAHLWATASRVLSGFGLAAIVAIPLGIALGRNTLLSGLLDPTLQLLRPVPVTAWLPLSMIIFGIGTKSTIALIFLGVFFPILINTLDGVKYVENRLVEAAQMLGTPKHAIFGRIILPAAMPGIITGLRIGLGFAWVLVVVGEMTGVPLGLGAVIMDARNLSRTDLIITGMVFIGVIGFLSDRVVLALSRRILWWNPSARA